MLVLQATNAGVRRPGYEATLSPGTSSQVARLSLVLVLQATNAGVRRPGYETGHFLM